MSSDTSLPWLVQNRLSAPICRIENKVEFLEGQFHSEKLSFLFPFVSFIGVFSILKCKTLVLKTTTSWTRASHFVDGWHLQRCQIRFFPHPLNGWHDHWTFVGGYGWFYWFSLYWNNFSQTSLELETFSPTYNGIRFLFSALYVMSDLFACFFPLEIGLQDSFSEITHNPLKSQMVGP